jgi:hypothetical protein
VVRVKDGEAPAVFFWIVPGFTSSNWDDVGVAHLNLGGEEAPVWFVVPERKT